MKKDILQFHIDNNYYIKLEKLEQINGIKLTFPERKVYLDGQTKRSWKIYEPDIDRLNIYKDGMKIKTFTLGEYFHRPFISLDIRSTCIKYKISRDLILWKVDSEGQFPFTDLFEIDETPKEAALNKILAQIKEKQNYSHIVSKYDFHDEIEIFKENIQVGGL